MRKDGIEQSFNFQKANFPRPPLQPGARTSCLSDRYNMVLQLLLKKTDTRNLTT